MLHYTADQLSIIVGLPIVTITLIWTAIIFQSNRRRWRPHDLLIVAILAQSILRNVTILAYVIHALILVAPSIGADFYTPAPSLGDDPYCRTITWLLNSLHTFQASSLTTLALVCLWSMQVQWRRNSGAIITPPHHLTVTHLICHLCSLTMLCACVGVASILAQPRHDLVAAAVSAPNDHRAYYDHCALLPHQLDVKYNWFVIALHVLMALVSLVAIVCAGALYWRMRSLRGSGDHLKKSVSDLSELSWRVVVPPPPRATLVAPSNDQNANYYDTYVVGGGGKGRVECAQFGGDGGAATTLWSSDVHSNVSMTVSSTNSRRPCLLRGGAALPACANNEDVTEGSDGNGVHGLYAVLAACYLFNHLPLIVLSIFPDSIRPWPVAGVALWMAQTQDVLIPIGLSLVDPRFCQWISNVYRCSKRKIDEKIPPGVGLDGRFRHFGSQPQSLDIHAQSADPTRTYHHIEPKFPITNGSLYTSIDGRVPIIHNYRRNKEQTGRQSSVCHANSVNLHSNYVNRVRKDACAKCDARKFNLHYDNHNYYHVRPSSHAVTQCERRRPVALPRRRRTAHKHTAHAARSLSQDSLAHAHLPPTVSARAPTQRLSRSEDCLLNEIESMAANESTLDSDDELYADSINLNEIIDDDDDVTSQSTYSITTEANCDFDFYAQRDLRRDEPGYAAHKAQLILAEARNNLETLDVNRAYNSSDLHQFLRNGKITRSNSKRSLENLFAYVTVEGGARPPTSTSALSSMGVQRSNSYADIEERYQQKMPISNSHYQQMEVMPRGKQAATASAHSESVPDFKKFFISEYI